MANASSPTTSAELLATLPRIELRLLDGAPCAVIYDEAGARRMVDAPLQVALLWFLRDGNAHSRHSVAVAIYGTSSGTSLKHLIRRTGVGDENEPEELLERTRTHLQLRVKVITDRMLMRADVEEREPKRALMRYDASPVDAQRRSPGLNTLPGRDLQVARLFEEMAADGLAGFIEAAGAHLDQLEAAGTPSGVEDLDRLLRKHCEEALEAEPLFERVRALREGIATSHVARASSNRPAQEDVPAVVSLVVEPSFASSPRIRRRPLLVAAALLFVLVVAASSWALQAPDVQPVPPRAALARLAVLDDSGAVKAFTVDIGPDSQLTFVPELTPDIGTPEWRRGVQSASGLNDLRLDPTDTDLVVLSHGERGVDIAHLQSDGTVAPMVRAAEDDYAAVFSADGRWMAYASARGSTRADHHVGVWLRDQRSGAEHGLRVVRGSYEQPLRFDQTEEALWVTSDHRATGAPELCRMDLGSERWDCRRVPRALSEIVSIHADTLVAIVAGDPANIDAQVVELVWGRISVASRTLTSFSNAGCVTHPTAGVAACVTTGGAIALISGVRTPARVRMVSYGHAAAKRAFFLPVPGEQVWELQPRDLEVFGTAPPTVSQSPDGGMDISLGESVPWQSGVLATREFDPGARVAVMGTVKLPLTKKLWQSARIVIGQLPLNETRAASEVAADSGPDGMDGFTRSGSWESYVCFLELPSGAEPQQPGSVILRSRLGSKTIYAALSGSRFPAPFFLEFDGFGSCVARVGGATVALPARAFPKRSIFVTVTGRAIATTGVVSGLAIRGVVAPWLH